MWRAEHLHPAYFGQDEGHAHDPARKAPRAFAVLDGGDAGVLRWWLTMVAGGIMFALLGKDPVAAIRLIFWDPLFNAQFAAFSRPQLLVKAGPLILIAIGLALGFRAGIWNIGAEGQYIIGAIFGAAVGLAFYPSDGLVDLSRLMVIAGALGGWAWAMIPAILKDAVQHQRDPRLAPARLRGAEHPRLGARATG
jgi:hypothetical protein